VNAAAARTIAAVLLLGGLVLVALYLFANRPAGTFGFTSTFLNGTPVARIDAVERGPAQQAGLRAGDLIAARGTRFIDRTPLYLFGNAQIVAQGDTVQVRVGRNGAWRDLALTAGADPHSPPFEALYFSIIGVPILLLGWFVVWMKPRSSDAITLGIMLLILGLWASMPDRVGSPAYRFIQSEIVGSAFYILGVFAAAVFFARYPEGQGTRISRLRRWLLAFVSVITLLELGRMAALFITPAYAGIVSWLQLPVPPIVLSLLATLACFIDAFVHGDATQRMRLRWLGGSYFIGFAGPVFIPTATVVLGSRFTTLDQVLFESTMFVLAAGLTYAVLRRRVIDIAFVLNRALVFAVVSGAVITFFLAFEWLVGMLFVNISPRTSYFVDAVAAILIGVFLRPLHARVDHSIDRVFFAKRHAAENALRHLATEIPFIRERSALLERIERDLTTYTDAALVAIYFREDPQGDFLLLRSTDAAPNTVPEIVDADDDAAVALAVDEAPVELHGRHTQMRGELAVPLAVRKLLVGMLVVGEKTSGEAYAPDELQSLRFLSGYLGTALASFSTPNRAGEETPTALLATLLSETRSQRGELRALSEDVAACRADINTLASDRARKI